MKIVTSDFEVLDSGVVYCPDMGDTKFIISEDPKMEIVFRVRKTEEKKKGIELEVDNEYTLVFVFYNPSGLGYGNAAPVKVGLFKGKALYANFHIDMKGDNQAYTLSYTFLMKEDENG